MRSPRNPESGAAMVIAIAIVMVVFTILFSAGQQNLDRLNVVLDMQRRAVVATQVMQDFAVIAQRANAVFERITGPLNCPGGTQRLPNPGTSRFCWSTTAGANCVRHPDRAAVTLCLNVSGQITISAHEVDGKDGLYVDYHPDRSIKAQAKEFWERAKLFAYYMQSGAAATFSNMAQAQNAAFHPAIAGEPVVDINNPVCSLAAPGTTDCKKCPGTAGANVTECLNVSLCVRADNCPLGAQQRITQRIAILPR
ncbi:MAG TPA: hypothetical protein PKC28_14610 [Bdellovibrionales bacterium]|nr:hypothetical protein [Bdellovibrionales bacterium]